MKAVVQRVREASVKVGDKITGEIGEGLLILLGVATEDTADEVSWVARKCAGLRIFRDENGRMNRSIEETGGEFLVVSQFTLYGDASKGRRPSFVKAADPVKGEMLYREFIRTLNSMGFRVQAGVFGAMMDVKLVNDGPVTIIIEKEGC